MDVFFSPLACSMASRIALYEAGAEARFIYVDGRTKRTETGEDFRAINPVGLVPAVRLDDGEVLTENAAILTYLAQRYATPKDQTAWLRLLKWIGFVNSELHTGCFTAILSATSPDAAKTYALEKAGERFALLDKHLTGREFLLDDYSVADGYLVTILNWTQVRGPALAAYPSLAAYAERVRARPAVARALGEELKLYVEEQKRHAA